jgi:CO dehydrogenase nickel-insertion accessory protein CooC1
MKKYTYSKKNKIIHTHTQQQQQQQKGQGALSDSPFAFGNMALAGKRTSSQTICPVAEPRRENLPSNLGVEKPLTPRSTCKKQEVGKQKTKWKSIKEKSKSKKFVSVSAYQEASKVSVLIFRSYQRQIRYWWIGNPCLCAIQNILVGFLSRI